MGEQEQRLWKRIEGERAEYGVPRVVCSALTPFPFWVVFASIVIFIPLALVVSYFVKRHAILVQGGELIVLDLSFWRYTVLGERRVVPLAAAEVSRDGGKLTIDGSVYYLEPGWNVPAERLISLTGASTEPPPLTAS